MDITFDRKTVGACLQQRFCLPTYQREYKWAVKHLFELITDIQDEFFEAYEDKHGRSEVGNYPPYFLGTIITTPEGEGRRGIIDGQQRLTTLTLVFSYFQRKSRLDPSLNISQIEPMLRRQVFGQAEFNIEFEDDRKQLLSVILDSEEEDPQELQDKVDSMPGLSSSGRTMFDLFNEIPSALSDRLDEKTTPYFVDYMMERVYLFEIGVSSEQDGHKVFVTMNDRGLKLSPIDLLKGHMLSNIRTSDNNRRANQVWTDTIRRLQVLGSEEDSGFFKAWLRAQYANTSRGKSRGDAPKDFELISDAYHRWVVANENCLGLKNSDDYYSCVINTIPFFADVYTKIKSNEKSYSEEYRFVYYNGCRDITLQAMVIMAAIDVKDSSSLVEKKIKLVIQYLDFILTARTIEGKDNTCDNIREIAFAIGKQIRKESFDNIRSIVLKDAKLNLETILRFGKANYYLSKRLDILFLLARCAEYLEREIEQTNSVGFAGYMDRSRGAKTFDIEHLLSVTEAIKSAKLSSMRHRMGALILLPRGRNRSLKNAPFDIKLSKYATENILAQTLVPGLYENNPQLTSFIAQTGISLKPMSEFGAAAIDERENCTTKLPVEYGTRRVLKIPNLLVDPVPSLSSTERAVFSVLACLIQRAARSGGQGWPQATAGGGAKRR